MKSVTFLVLLFIVSTVKSQVVELRMNNLSDNYDCFDIYINQQFNKTGCSPLVLLSAKENDTIDINSPNYRVERIILSSELFKNDTAKINVFLKEIDQQYNEVVVTSEKIKEVFREENVNVLDYYPTDNLCYFLLKKENQYFLQLKATSKLLSEEKIPFRPIQFTRDFMGNIHVESKDSVYQIFLREDGFSFKSISQKSFQKDLVPLVDAGANYLIRQQNKNHNKRYELVRSTGDSVQILFKQFDLIGQQMAAHQYGVVISLYYKIAEDYENVIELGTWNGDLNELAIHRELVKEIGFYNLLKREVNCTSIELKNQLFVFDFFEDRILTYLSEKGVKSAEKSFSLPKGFKVLLKDLENETLYLCSRRAGTRKYYRFDSNDSNSFVPLDLSESKFRYNVKFSNGWMYFQIKNDTGNGRVYREKAL